MKTIFDAIKEEVAYCSQRGYMFSLPSVAKPYVTEHNDNGIEGGFWRLEKGEQWITISYESRDTSRPYIVGPDKSIISVKGNIMQEVSYSNSWLEGRL